MSKYATSAASSPGLTWIENVLSCLEDVGVIDAPETVEPARPTERRSYAAASISSSSARIASFA